MLYCTNCGYRTTADGEYCARCGQPLSPFQAEAVPCGVTTSGGGQWGVTVVALGIFLVLLCIFPVTGISTVLAKLAGGIEQAATVWYSSNFMGLAILAVVWFLALRGRAAESPPWG